MGPGGQGGSRGVSTREGELMGQGVGPWTDGALRTTLSKGGQPLQLLSVKCFEATWMNAEI